MKTNTDFAKYLSRFLSEYLPHHRNLSPNTIKSYTDSFYLFIRFMRDYKSVPVEKLSLEVFTPEVVTDFLFWIKEKRNCGNATRNYRLAAISSFAQYLQYEAIGRMEQWQRIIGIKALKTEKRTVNYLSVEGIKLMLEQPDTQTEKGRRNLALLALMYDTGARVQEIIDLTPESLRIESRPYTIRLLGKGRKNRIVPLMDEQVELLRNYMDEHHLYEPQKNRHPLFYNNRREKLTRAGVSYILSLYINMARKLNPAIIPDKVSCHSLRHSKVMYLLQNGVNIVYIRDILGHSSLQTTDIYARADSKQKREALEKAYIDLTPNRDNQRLWERDQTLLEWLQSMR
jgi:site-specific recombinase XerD